MENQPYSVNDIIMTSSTTDVTGLLPSTKYKIKSISQASSGNNNDVSSSFDLTLVPEATMESNIATTTEVDLQYVPAFGSLGTTKTTFIKPQLTLSIPFTSQPNGATETITFTSLPNTPSLQVGDSVTYKQNTDALITGLTDEETYVVASVDTATNGAVGITLTSATTSEWKLGIASQDMTESVGATVTQGSNTGTLKTVLSGATTNVVIETKPGVTFVNTEDVVIGSSTTVIASANINTAVLTPTDLIDISVPAALGDVNTPPSTTFVRASFLCVLAYADADQNTITLAETSGIHVNDIIQSSSTTDITGVEKNTNYKIKSIDGYAVQLVPGTTPDNQVAATNAVELTYKGPIGTPGSSKTVLTKLEIGSQGSNVTQLLWNMTVNLTIVDDRSTPMPGKYIKRRKRASRSTVILISIPLSFPPNLFHCDCHVLLLI